jgi:hypothetical protein
VPIRDAIVTGRQLLLLLRVGDAAAREHVLATLRDQGGDVSATARLLGVSPDSLYVAAKRDAAWGRRFRALCQGLDGARRAAVRARRARVVRRVVGGTKEVEET